MIRPLNLLFVLADAGHGRLVGLSRVTGDYFTIVAHLADKPPRKGEPTAVFQSFGEGLDTTEQGDGAVVRAEQDFVRVIAAEAVQVMEQGGFAGIALVAPPRTLAMLKRFLPSNVAVMGELAKDLTKVRDHDLAAWLAHVRPATAS